jgi:hypothetical protein
MVQSITYAGGLQVQDTNRGPSQSIWDTPEILEFIQNPAKGYHFWDDFTGFPDFALFNGERQIGQWDCWVGNNAGATIGTGADTTNLPLEGGVIGITGGTTAIDVTMAGGVPGFRLISPATGFAFGTKLWFETRIAVSTLTTANLDLFVGLMDAGWSGTHITSAASEVFSSTNTLKTAAGMGGCLGFWKRATSNPTDIAVAYNVNNGTVQLPGTTSTLQKLLTNSLLTGYTSGLTAMTSTSGVAAANTFVKLGFIFDPTNTAPRAAATSAVTTNQTAGTVYNQRIQFFVNGVPLPWFLTTSDIQASTFSSSWMVPVIGYRSGGTGTGIAYCDWVRCAQKAAS